MKRTIIILLTVAASVIAVGWLLPWVIFNGRLVVLALIEILPGLLLSFLLSRLAFRLAGVSSTRLTKPTRFAVRLTELFVTLALATVINTHLIRDIGKFLFASPNWSVSDNWRAYQKLDGILGFAFTIVMIGASFYVLVRIYEETLGKRAKSFSRSTALEVGWRLPLKLFAASIIVYLLVLSIWSISLLQENQFLLNQGGRWYKARNDSIGIIYFNNSGFSHQGYLKNIYRLCTELQKRKTRSVLVPLPANLLTTPANLDLLRDINKLGLVVFAVPPEERIGYTRFWVNHPAKGLFKLDWGVLSAVKLEAMSYYASKYFPLAYQDASRGDVIPDAAIPVVQMYRGEASRTELRVNEKQIRVGPSEIDLYRDTSAPIQYSLDAFSSPRVFVYGEEGQDTLQYSDLTQFPTAALVNELDKFENRIVIIDPGSNITTFVNFSNIYAQIIDQILKEKRIIPLDGWTRVLVPAFILIAAALFFFYKPWLASLGVVALTVGQGFFCSWLNNHYGLLVEYIPLTITGISTIIVFVFVRVNHERGQLLEAEKQRALEELQTARDMQMGLMPKADPEVKGFEIAGICLPAREVGGDFYDYVWLDSKKSKLGIAIADVSGKSMKAAMTAVMTSGMLYSEVAKSQSPRDILARINRPLYLRTDKRVFTTMALAVIDVKKRALVYSSAGHLPPLIVQKNAVQYLKAETTGLPLGIQEELVYKEARVKLQRGDRAIFYTDGISEAMNEQKEQYGNERLEALVKNNALVSAKDIRDKILADVSAFTGSAEQHDDMTVVVVKVL